MKKYKWFDPRPCTLDEGAKMYRELASKHHPDHGGNTSDMQEINNEWDELKPTPAEILHQASPARPAAVPTAAGRQQRRQGCTGCRSRENGGRTCQVSRAAI